MTTHISGLKSFAEVAGAPNPESYWRCSLCSLRFLNYQDVKCGVFLSTGNGGGRNYNNVCFKCYAKATEVIDREFPKNCYLAEKKDLYQEEGLREEKPKVD